MPRTEVKNCNINCTWEFPPLSGGPHKAIVADKGSKVNESNKKIIKKRPDLDSLGTNLRSRLLPAVKSRTYTPKSTRDLAKYSELIQVNILGMMARYFIRVGHISVLDAGCGQAIFCEEVLSAMRDKLRAVYGISIDDSRQAAQLQDREPKFTFIHNSVENVLPMFRANKVDLIFDIFGPATYGKDIIQVLRLYYEHLSIGGKAFIFLGSCFDINGSRTPDVEISFCTARGNFTYPEYIFYGLNRLCPKIFQLSHADNLDASRVLVLCKMQQEFPIEDYSLDYSPYVGFSLRACNKNAQELVDEGAGMPREVKIKVTKLSLQHRA